jgi:peptidoglycan/xylan/chitin deacetylase (PgdA/CDA1 family)
MPRELILTFHGLGEPPDSIADTERNVWVPVQWFEAIIDAAPRNGVGLAFDDGNASDVLQALPALAGRGMTARFFPLTGRLGEEGYLSAEDIAGLSAAGMVVGSHGCHHRDWRTLTDGELHEELTVSRRALVEIVDTDITEAACPFGSYDRRVLRALRAAGYRHVFTSDGGTHAIGAWPASRTTVDRSRPLQDWLDLARTGARKAPSPTQRGKRLLKRVR